MNSKSNNKTKSILHINKHRRRCRSHSSSLSRRSSHTARGGVGGSSVTGQICICVTFLMFSLVINSRPAQTRRLQPCEFAGQLYILDIPKVELPLWLCIAEYESRFNTHAIGSRNLDGSLDYGIFQISDKFWCKPQNETTTFHYYNECNVDCSDLISDDITLAVKCAQRIQKQQGWSAWTVYDEFCNDTLVDDIEIEQCFA